MSVDGCTPNVRHWLTVSSEGSGLSMGASVSFVYLSAYVDGRAVSLYFVKKRY